jgi:hypothetical protein
VVSGAIEHAEKAGVRARLDFEDITLDDASNASSAAMTMMGAPPMVATVIVGGHWASITVVVLEGNTEPVDVVYWQIEPGAADSETLDSNTLSNATKGVDAASMDTKGAVVIVRGFRGALRGESSTAGVEVRGKRDPVDGMIDQVICNVAADVAVNMAAGEAANSWYTAKVDIDSVSGSVCCICERDVYEFGSIGSI